jgi:hypothetical protein
MKTALKEGGFRMLKTSRVLLEVFVLLKNILND